MKAIMVMYDSLNRRLLESYGCDWTRTPNFLRLAEHSMQFDSCYVGSMPCMPARRELHTGRANFLHRSWGPIEPFDDSMPEILKKNGIHTHLATDHDHYWEDGGATYHPRYSTHEFFRGQESDCWRAELNFVPEKRSVFEGVRRMWEMGMVGGRLNNQRNQCAMPTEEMTSQARTFAAGIEFLDTNHSADNWFLHIESFDPHEPFIVEQKYKDHFESPLKGEDALGAEWPPYATVRESEDVVKTVRAHYAALLEKCDANLGRVLDAMDRYDLWKDTMLIVCTDHGYLLGEHGWWAKNFPPMFNEIANTPLYVYDPRFDCAGKHSDALVQMPDLAATLLEFFHQEIPADMTGKPLRSVMEKNEIIHPFVCFGNHGMAINVTDGRYVYMHEPEHPEDPFYDYTLMPTHMIGRFSVEELKDAVLAEPFSFTKGLRVLKVEVRNSLAANMSKITGYPHRLESALYDLQNDPEQLHPIDDPETISRMKEMIRTFMIENDAPQELYHRYGIEK